MRTLLFALFTSLFAILTAGCASHQSAPASRPPNILIFLTDDLGIGELGCYGQKIIRTPHLDAFAADSVLFTQAYSGSPVCAPSRCCLLTGYHTGHSAIRDNKEIQPEGQQPLPSSETTIATLLRSAGYSTMAIGKWGLGPPGSSGDPFSHGFDHFFGYNCQRHAHNHCPAWLYDDRARIDLPGNSAKYSSSEDSGPIYAPDLFRDQALSFIDRSKDSPFFLLFATTIPHAALQAPEADIAEYSSQFPDPPYDGKKGYLKTQHPRATYAAMVTRMDLDFGAIIAKLRALNLLDNTLIIFTSDNGPTFNGGTDSAFFSSAQGRRGLKCEVYEGGIRVPLLIRAPGGTRGTTHSTPCAVWDLFPTIASYANITLPPSRDGITLSPALTSNQPLAARDYLYWEYPSGGWSQAARFGNFKAVRTGVKKNPNAPIQIFDLETDPSETTNLAATRPDLVARADSILRSARTPAQLPEWNP
jgi:arylsulfatase